MSLEIDPHGFRRIHRDDEGERVDGGDRGKSLIGSNGSCLKMCGAAASVELAGVMWIV